MHHSTNCCCPRRFGSSHWAYSQSISKVYFGLTAFFSAGGAASATRHLYLQSLPADQVPTCGPDLAYLIDKSYFADALRMLFIGDGNCAEIMWSLLGISIPGWVLICCTLILISSSYPILVSKKV